MCEMGHKRGHWCQMHGDVGLCCMSCDTHMHAIANATMESGVMRMGQEPGRKTSTLEHGLIKVLIVFLCWRRGYVSDGVVLQCFWVADRPKTARLVFSVGGVTLAFPWDYAVRRLHAGGKVEETRSFLRCQSA